MCLEVKVGSSLLHALPVEVAVELGCLLGCLLNVLRDLAGFHLLGILLLHLLRRAMGENMLLIVIKTYIHPPEL